MGSPLAWLLAEDSPPWVRYRVRRDLLGQGDDDPQVQVDRRALLASTDQLATLSTDFNALVALLRHDKVAQALAYRHRLDTAGLVAALDSPNGWQRDRAMEQLVARRDPTAIGRLRALLQPSHRPQVRVQALATLGLLGAVDFPTLAAALGDPHPSVRCQALVQAERLAPESRETFDAAAALAADPDPAVRLQTAFTLGQWPPALCEPVLRELATRDAHFEHLPQVRLARELR